MGAPVIYDEGLTDSRRWTQLELRPGDIVISVPSKCGTTWLQMICALLIFGSKMPGPLTHLSPWLDMRLQPISDVAARLDGQRHRRFIKTHTPLDGVPNRDDVTYVVMGRDPRDVAVSMSHHRSNLDTDAIHARLGIAQRSSHVEEIVAATPDLVRREVMAWIDRDDPVQVGLSSLKGLAWHLGQAWHRRSDPNVVLLHYGEVCADLPGTMRTLARRLGIAVDPSEWSGLISAAGFESMRANATRLVPDEGLNLLKRSTSFFHAGTSGQWSDIMTPEDLTHYDARIATLAEPAVCQWLHQDA